MTQPQATAAAGAEYLWRLHPALVRYCQSRISSGGPVSADDVAQEVLLGVLQALPRYRGNAEGFPAFVFGIARHKVADVLRARYRDRSTPVSELPEAVDPTAVEQRVLDGERRAEVFELMETLTPVQRKVLWLRAGAGMSTAETAQLVSHTANSVRVIQHRALARLRRELAERRSAQRPATR